MNRLSTVPLLDTRFGAGMFLIPGWFKVLWAAGCLAAVVALPAIWEKVLDPVNIRRITRHLADVGATAIEVEPFPNHHGARYTRNGVRHYARCSVKRGKVQIAERGLEASRKVASR